MENKLKGILHIIILLLAAIGVLASCQRQTNTYKEAEQDFQAESKNRSEKLKAYDISPENVGDTTFYIRQEYDENSLHTLYTTGKTGTFFDRFRIFSNEGDISIRDNGRLLNISAKTKKSLDQSALAQLKGRYVSGTILKGEIFISHWDFFCRNRRMEISDTSIFDVIGCEGFYAAPMINVYQKHENHLVIEALNYPILSQTENESALPIATYHFYTSELETKGLVIVESIFTGRKLHYYLIHEDYLYQYKELKCHQNYHDPCPTSLSLFIADNNEQQILEKLESLKF